MLGVPVDQVDLLGVDVLQRLLVQAVVVHVLIVGFVYVPLFSDERRLRELLSGREEAEKEESEEGGREGARLELPRKTGIVSEPIESRSATPFISPQGVLTAHTRPRYLARAHLGTRKGASFRL